ncbi:MAG: hypothetical protein QXF15_02040 [Candidatus Aenigmatarchaeota archaeon]
MPEEISIINDLLAPTEKKIIKFSGEHPSRLLDFIPKLEREILKIESSDFFEDSIKWDNSGNPISFYAEWRAKQEQDNYTELWIKTIVQGTQDSSTKKGEVMIVLTGFLRTKFTPKTFLHYLFFLMYMKLFYHKQREIYVKNGKQKLEEVEYGIRRLLNVLEQER